MIRKVHLALAFGLAASCAHAQTAPSPADVGISKGNPDVFKLKGHDNAWTPFGSIDPVTHIFTPVGGGGGAINTPPVGTTPISGGCPNGQFLYNNAGAVDCVAVAGGGGSTAITFYPTHALLTAGVTAPASPSAVVQQGFYASGDGGDATYQWNATSYCPSGTSSVPFAADGIGCVLPIGQSASTAGRYLLSISNGALNVRQVGMMPGGMDNYPIAQTLMKAISPGASNEGTLKVVFPATLGQRYTTYYFSQPFVISRNMNMDCEASTAAGDGPVVLAFPPGIDGVIQEAGYFTPDGNWGQGSIRSCKIVSMGGGAAAGSPGSNAIINVSLNGNVDGIPYPVTCNPTSSAGPCTVGAGDGVIMISQYQPEGLAVNSGAYVAASPAPTPTSFTLASPYTLRPLSPLNHNVALWDLPASQKYTIQTTMGSATAVVTAGPRPLRHGDMLWTEAFLFGAGVINQDSNNSFPQTIDVTDVTMTHSVIALKTGTFQMWTVPAGLKRRVNATSERNVLDNFGVGLDLICQGGTPPTGCDNTLDVHNWYISNLIGRLARGNNTTNTTVINNVGGHNSIADNVEAGTLGSTYLSDEYNSQESADASYGVLVFCGTQNYSNFIGTYLAGQNHGPCMGSDVQGNPSLDVAAQDGVAPSELFIGSTYGYSNISAQSFAGSWTYTGPNSATMTTTTTSPTGQNVIAVAVSNAFYRGMNITDLTNPVIPDGTTVSDFTTAGVVLSNNLTGTVQVGDQIQFSNTVGSGGPCVSIFPGLNSSNGMYFSIYCTTIGLGITFNGINGLWSIGPIAFPTDGYLGYSVGGNNIPVFSSGLVMGNNNQDYTGEQRLLDFGLAPSTDAFHLQGDTRLNQVPVPGGNMAWVNTQVGATTTLSAAVVSGTTTSVAVAACPNPALPAGTPVDRVAQFPDNHSIQLNTLLGTLNTCTGTTLTFQAAASNSAVSGDTIQFLQWRPAGLIANDAAGTQWTLGNYMTLTPIALASLPATCTAGTFAVINNGVAAPVYNAAVGSTTGAATDPVFCTNGNVWKYH